MVFYFYFLIVLWVVLFVVLVGLLFGVVVGQVLEIVLLQVIFFVGSVDGEFWLYNIYLGVWMGYVWLYCWEQMFDWELLILVDDVVLSLIWFIIVLGGWQWLCVVWLDSGLLVQECSYWLLFCVGLDSLFLQVLLLVFLVLDGDVVGLFVLIVQFGDVLFGLFFWFYNDGFCYVCLVDLVFVDYYGWCYLLIFGLVGYVLLGWMC